jgi:hypothetical protein
MDIDKIISNVEAMKKWIDAASYMELLDKWRFAPVGSPWFVGEIGKYYAKVMSMKRNQDPGGAVMASKSLGWDR